MQALSEFRIWLEVTYVVEKLPAYTAHKVEQGLFAPAAAEIFLNGFGGTLPKTQRQT